MPCPCTVAPPGSEEEEMCMEVYAVQAVEGLVEGGKGPKKGSLANSV